MVVTFRRLFPHRLGWMRVTALAETVAINFSQIAMAGNPQGVYRPSQKETSIPTIHFQVLCLFQGVYINVYLVGGFSPTHLKNMRKSNWIISPKFWGENKKCLKAPPRNRSSYLLSMQLVVWWCGLGRFGILGVPLSNNPFTISWSIQMLELRWTKF